MRQMINRHIPALLGLAFGAAVHASADGPACPTTGEPLAADTPCVVPLSFAGTHGPVREWEKADDGLSLTLNRKDFSAFGYLFASHVAFYRAGLDLQETPDPQCVYIHMPKGSFRIDKTGDVFDVSFQIEPERLKQLVDADCAVSRAPSLRELKGTANHDKPKDDIPLGYDG